MDKHKRNNWDFETSMKNILFPWFFPLVHTTNEDLSSGFCIVNVIPRDTK